MRGSGWGEGIGHKREGVHDRVCMGRFGQREG